MGAEIRIVSELIPLQEEYINRIVRINNCNMIINYEEDIRIAEQYVEEGLKNIGETRNILPLIDPYNNCLSELKDIDSILKQASHITDLEDMVVELETVIKNYKILMNYQEEYIKTLTNINITDKTINSKGKELQEYISKYEVLLKELGTCPR